MNRESVSYFWSCALLVTASLLLALGHLTAGHNWGDDFAQYIMQAQAIADGTVAEFLEANRRTIEHSYLPMGPVAYPWGLPLLLAPLYAWFGVNLTAFKMVGVVSFFLFLVVYAGYVRRHHAVTAALLLVACFAVNPVLLGFINIIGSDIPFMLVSTAAVLLIMRRTANATLGLGVLTGGMIAVAALLRTNGILLVIPLAASQCDGLLQALLHRSGYHAGFRSLFSIRHAVPWLVFFTVFVVGGMLLPGGGSSHVGHLETVSWGTIQNNILNYFKLPLAFYEGVPGRWMICLLTYPLAIIGGLVRVRREYPLILYVLATLGIYVIWPDAMQGLRFLFPLLPFYLSFCLTGYVFLANRLSPPGNKAAIGAGSVLLVYVVVMMGITSISLVYKNHRSNRAPSEGPFTKVSTALFDDIIQFTKPTDHVVFFKPRVMRLMTGRPSTIQRELSSLESGDYVVLYRDPNGLVWPMPEELLSAAVKNGMVKNIQHTDQYAIYRVKP